VIATNNKPGSTRTRRPHLKVVIGQVFSLPKRREYESRKEGRQADADFIMERLAELLPPEYRGVYADSVKG